MWPEMTITRPGSVVPLWIASTSTIAVGVGTRGPVKSRDGVSMARQPPQALE
jgi:hypothetical protein